MIKFNRCPFTWCYRNPVFFHPMVPPCFRASEVFISCQCTGKNEDGIVFIGHVQEEHSSFPQNFNGLYYVVVVKRERNQEIQSTSVLREKGKSV